jgi:GNAT superfamily N-acetyltransferase
MDARPARPDDAPEVVRLARLMFESVGADLTASEWEDQGTRHVGQRLGQDLGVFVVDHPDGAGVLVASAAGTVATRLPVPANPSGRVGYVQWVATEPAFRRQGMARAVMEGLLAWYGSQEVHVLELHATPEGEPLYRSLGFGDEGGRALRRRGPMPPG